MQAKASQRDALELLCQAPPKWTLSLYISLDTHSFPTPKSLKSQIRSLADSAHSSLVGEDGIKIKSQLEQFEGWFLDGFKRSGARSLCVFIDCENISIYTSPKILTAPCFVYDKYPYLNPWIEELPGARWGYLAINRREGALFVGRRDNLEREELPQEDVHRQHHQGGWSQARFQRGIEQEVDWHLDSALEMLFSSYQTQPFDYLLISCPGELETRIIEKMHPYLTEKIVKIKNHDLDPNLIDLDQLSEEMGELECESRLKSFKELWEARHDHHLTDLSQVVEAVNQKRVAYLLAGGNNSEGWMCRECGSLSISPGQCGLCGGELLERDNIKADLARLTIQSGGEVLLSPQEDLPALGALSRW